MEKLFKQKNNVPIVFIDASTSDQLGFLLSVTNDGQTEMGLEVMKEIRRRNQKADCTTICLYNGQKGDIAKVAGPAERLAILDSYQGGEADYIILATLKDYNIAINESINDPND